MLGVLFLVTAVAILYAVVVHTVPSFGGDLSNAQKQAFEKLSNFKGGKFSNRRDVPEKLSFSKFMTLGHTFFTTKVVNGTPSSPLAINKIDSLNLANFEGTRLFWFGHSAFLLQHKKWNILIDPMMGNVPAPLSFLGGKRFTKTLPIPPENLPEIDAVIYSHDHYDHLDYETVIKIKNKVKRFIVPLGIGNHLKRWGVDEKNITELNWWASNTFDDITFVCTPAQHFSGRKFSNGQQTLWSSWVIQSDAMSLYFSGDSGYDRHFKDIGEKYGPFDLALLECGQYNSLWPDVHMFPKQTVQAGIDLEATKIVPIHWGAFKLAMHPWNEPAIEVFKEAKKRNIRIEIPKIGEAIALHSNNLETNTWWE